MPDESWLVLTDLLEEPVETITVGAAVIKVFPAGLAELRDFGKFAAMEGLQVDDELPSGKTILDFWLYVFWLLLRNGTPGMTPERARTGDWGITLETVEHVLPKFLHTKGLQIADWQKGISELAVEAGLFSREVAGGEAPGGESPMPTPNSPPPVNESMENGGSSQDGQ